MESNLSYIFFHHALKWWHILCQLHNKGCISFLIYFKLYFPEILMLLPILLLASLEAFPVATWTDWKRPWSNDPTQFDLMSLIPCNGNNKVNQYLKLYIGLKKNVCFYLQSARVKDRIETGYTLSFVASPVVCKQWTLRVIML